MAINIKYIKIIGHNNLVIQDLNGDITEITIKKFMSLFTKEKDIRIKLLQASIKDKEKIESLKNNEISSLICEIHEIRAEKAELENRISKLLFEFNGKDISATEGLYQEAFSLFLNGNLSKAIECLSEKKLQGELKKINEQETALIVNKHKLAELFALKGRLLYLSEDYLLSIEKYLEAIKLTSDVSYFWNDLSANYYAIGNLKAAFDSAEKALAIDIIKFGENSYQVGLRLSRVGIIQSSLGQFHLAEKSFEKSITIGITFDSQDVLIEAYLGLAGVYDDRKEYKKSIYYNNKVLCLINNEDNDNQRLLSHLYNNMGFANYQLENFTAAIDFFEQSLKIKKQELNQDILIDGNIFYNIGCAKIGLENIDEGSNLIQHGFEIDLKRLGEDHFSMAKYYKHFASCTNAFVEKKKFLLKAVKINEGYYGEHHFVTGNAYYDYGILLQTYEMDSEALKYLKKAGKIQLDTFGNNDVTFGVWCISIGTSYLNLNLLAEGLNYFEAGQEILRTNINSENEHLKGLLFLAEASKIIGMLRK